jgi:hypothetical protein
MKCQSCQVKTAENFFVWLDEHDYPEAYEARCISCTKRIIALLSLARPMSWDERIVFEIMEPDPPT